MVNLIDSLKHLWFLEGKLCDGKTLQIKIDKTPFIIGRDKECCLTLSAKTVSRRHTEIYLKGISFAVRDLNSTNGTFVNNIRVKEEMILNDGDTISFADQHFKLFTKDNKIKEDGSKTNYIKGPLKEITFAEFYELTKREEEILFQILSGKSTKEIADSLFISLGTAKNHLINIFKKTNVHSRFELLTQYNNFSASLK